jgi:DNA-binding MarR family transcriptional regulator
VVGTELLGLGIVSHHAKLINHMKTNEIYHQPGHLIRRAHQIATAIFMSEAKAFDLTPIQFAALIVIRDTPGIDASKVADLVYFDRSTIGNVLERLERKGLIIRKPGVHDRRTKALFLTPEGKVVTRKITAKSPVISERILESLTETERKTFLDMLRRLAPNGSG